MPVIVFSRFLSALVLDAFFVDLFTHLYSFMILFISVFSTF